MTKSIVPFDPLSVIPSDENLDRAADKLVEGAYAKNTKRAYFADWKMFSAYCEAKGETNLPSSVRNLYRYIGYMENLYACTTILRKVSAIAEAHKKAGHKSPSEHPNIQAALRSIRNKINIDKLKRVKPILPEDLARWLPLLPQSVRSTRDKALLTVGLSGAFRRAELAALDLRHIEPVDRGLLITVVEHKTANTSDEVVKGIFWGNSDKTCPVRNWELWREVADPVLSGDTAPAFLSIKGTTVTEGRISGQTVARAVKRLVKLGGANPDEYSGHSLRAGFVTSAVRAGCKMDRIMAQTGHKSHEVLQRYIRRESIWEENPSGMIGL